MREKLISSEKKKIKKKKTKNNIKAKENQKPEYNDIFQVQLKI